MAIGHYSPEKVDLSLTRRDGDATLLDCIQHPQFTWLLGL